MKFDFDAKEDSPILNWRQNALFARESFAPIFSELRGNRLLDVENGKIGGKLIVNLHPEEALAKKTKSGGEKK